MFLTKKIKNPICYLAIVGTVVYIIIWSGLVTNTLSGIFIILGIMIVFIASIKSELLPLDSPIFNSENEKKIFAVIFVIIGLVFSKEVLQFGEGHEKVPLIIWYFFSLPMAFFIAPIFVILAYFSAHFIASLLLTKVFSKIGSKIWKGNENITV